MSSTPEPAAVSTNKRPLDEEEEEASSPTNGHGQHDAKRPYLGEKATNSASPSGAVKAETTDDSSNLEAKTSTNGKTKGQLKTEPITNIANDTVLSVETLPDAPPATGSPVSAVHQQVDESKWIHIRSIISSQEAATVIGKGGENVTAIRRIAGAKCTVSDYQKGQVERILTVSGPVDAVAKAFGLIVRTLNNEALDTASTPQSKSYGLRLLVPHILIGSIIGKGGSRIREIQDASGARLNVSESALPLSTERSLVILGVADAVHIAAYYVGTTLVEQLTERFGGPAASAYASRSGGPAGVVPGGMQVVPYAPQPMYGNYGHPDNYRRHTNQNQRTPANPYGIPYLHGQAPTPQAQAPMHYQDPAQQAYSPVGPHQPQHGAPIAQGPIAGGPQGPMGGPQAGAPMGQAMPGQPITQQIFIPNDMVGAIIGKGGAKINEIRQLSGSVIKINEPQDNSNERLVTITGTQDCNQMALYMLYSRLESEKHRI